MKAQEPEKYERDWKSMRSRSMGDLLEKKLRADTSPYWRVLTEMELERRTFVRDKMIDRCLAGLAVVVSITALFLAATRPTPVPAAPPSPAPFPAIPSPHTPAPQDPAAKTP